MYSLFRSDPTVNRGVVIDPKRPYIRRQIEQQIDDVKSYYRRFPKTVNATNLISLIINQFVLEFKSNDFEYARKVERQMKTYTRSIGMTDATNRGKVFMGTATLGPQAEEIVISDIARFDTENLKASWRELQPIKYLYHSRSDINLPIMNNTTPGIAYGVTSINIPMLMVQYRHYVYRNFGTDTDMTDVNIGRYVGMYPLVNAIESYVDIAYFNRLARQAYSMPRTKYPLPHPFYIPDLTPVVDKMAENTIKARAHKATAIEQTAQITPMLLKDNLYELIQLPPGPVTMQNDWALAIARLPYIKYLVDTLKLVTTTDRTQSNLILNELRESLHSQSFKMNGSSPMLKRFLEDVEKVIADLEHKGLP